MLPQLPFLRNRKRVRIPTSMHPSLSLLGCDQPQALPRRDDLGRIIIQVCEPETHVSKPSIFISTRSLPRNILVPQRSLFSKIAWQVIGVAIKTAVALIRECPIAANLLLLPASVADLADLIVIAGGAVHVETSRDEPPSIGVQMANQFRWSGGPSTDCRNSPARGIGVAVGSFGIPYAKP